MRGVAVLGDSSSSLSSECCRRSAGRVLSPLVVSVSWQPVVDDVTSCGRSGAAADGGADARYGTAWQSGGHGAAELTARQCDVQTDGLPVIRFSARLSVMSDYSAQIYTVSYSYSWPARLQTVSGQLGRRSTVDRRTGFPYKILYVHLNCLLAS